MASFAKTLTDVANYVLLLLGEPALTGDIDTDTTEKGKSLRRAMRPSIEAVQDEYAWAELVHALAVSPDSERHHDGRYRYRLPEDCIFPLGLQVRAAMSGPQTWMNVGARNADGFVDHEAEGNFLLGALDGLSVVYVRRSLNPGEWSPQLFKAIAYRWAADAAMILTNDANVAGLRMQQYEKLVRPRSTWRQAYSLAAGEANQMPTGYRSRGVRMGRGPY
ncbi:MAG: hypothetical protein Q7Q73_02485 [Verrucomicrobiota bacterium JB024]|nr:hypothetical protein [Verrucomicrobiota bacterium JB024]